VGQSCRQVHIDFAALASRRLLVLRLLVLAAART
jgi:hypothetical protein